MVWYGAGRGQPCWNFLKSTRVSQLTEKLRVTGLMVDKRLGIQEVYWDYEKLCMEFPYALWAHAQEVTSLCQQEKSALVSGDRAA